MGDSFLQMLVDEPGGLTTLRTLYETDELREIAHGLRIAGAATMEHDAMARCIWNIAKRKAGMTAMIVPSSGPTF